MAEGARKGETMRLMRVILAAILVIAALALVAGPAGADCPDGQDLSLIHI